MEARLNGQQTTKAKSLSPQVHKRSTNNNMATDAGVRAGLAEVSRMLLHPDYSPLASTGHVATLQSLSDREDNNDRFLSQSLDASHMRSATPSAQRRRVLSDVTPVEVLVRKREHISNDSLPSAKWTKTSQERLQRTSARSSYTNSAFRDSSDADDVTDDATHARCRRSRIHHVVDFLKPSRFVRRRARQRQHKMTHFPEQPSPVSSAYYGFYSAPVSRASTPVSAVASSSWGLSRFVFDRCSRVRLSCQPTSKHLVSMILCVTSV